MKTRAAFIFLTFIFFVSAGCRTRHGDTYSTADAPPPVGLNADQPGALDSHFVSDALVQGAEEIQLGRIASERAEDLDLKLLAQRVLDDRARANRELQMIAQLEKVPRVTASKNVSTIDFSNLSGAAFDRAYVRHLLNVHRSEIKKCRAASRDAYNDEIRAFAGRMLATLQEHVRIAENISSLAQLGEDVNEPAGAERQPADIDPYYQGDSKVRHQFNPE